MIYNYAEKWSRSYKEAIKPLTEAQARKRHEKKGALYTALLGDDPARPQTFVEIVSGDSIQVEFLDQSLRTKAYYQFVLQPDGRLFMVSAVVSDFDANGTCLIGRRFSFKPNGHVMRFETDYIASPDTETVVEKTMDMSLNWEPYPEFGDYASIARFERNAPPKKAQHGVA